MLQAYTFTWSRYLSRIEKYEMLIIENPVL